MSEVLRPQAGKQAMFINLRDDGLDENGIAIGEGKEIDYIFYGGGAGGGKVCPDDQMVITPYGLKRHGDLKEGDELYNPNGQKQKVKAVYPHENWCFYEITFCDGSKAEAGLEHLWRASTSRENLTLENENEVMSTEQIKEVLESGGVVYMPCPDVIPFKDYDLNLDEIADIVASFDIPEDLDRAGLTTRSIFVNLLETYYGAEDDINVLYIPDIRKSNVVLRVLRSLGYYAANLYENVIYFEDNEDGNFKRVRSINFKRKCNGSCITVDNPNALYLLEDYVVTHNTWAILFDNLKYIDDPNYFSVFFRKTITELKTNLWPEALRMYEPFLKYPKDYPDPEKAGKFRGKAHIDLQDRTITFPSGAKSTFTYMDLDKDADKWYGSELTRVYFDEFQMQSEYCYDVIRSRLRSKSKYKSCLRATLNPDQSHFVLDWILPYLDDEGFPKPELAGRIRYFIMLGGTLHSSWDRETLEAKFSTPDSKKTAKTYTYIPSTLEDNKILMEMEADYKDSLDSLSEEKRKQLLLGCWFNTNAGCMYYNRDHVKTVAAPPLGVTSRVRSWDLAGTEYDPNASPKAYARNPDWTAGVLMSKYEESRFSDIKEYCVEDVVRVRYSTAKVEELIFETARKDREQYGDVLITLPCDPNPASERYIRGLISKLLQQGFRAKTFKTNKAKADRFRHFSVASEGGFVSVVKADWNKDYHVELETFTGLPEDRHKTKDDQVDATSDAFNTLNSASNIKPVTIPKVESGTLLSRFKRR